MLFYGILSSLGSAWFRWGMGIKKGSLFRLPCKIGGDLLFHKLVQYHRRYRA